HRSHYVLSAAAAGACLVLSACGASSAPGASGSPSAGATAAGSSGMTTATGHFCDDASSFMRHIPAAPADKHASAVQARANLRTVLKATVKGFAELEAEAPHKLHKPLKRIVAIYRSDEKVIRKDGSLAQISESMVRGNSKGSSAFQKVLKYIAVSCK
ncbi:MAG TPA: hypothetical protein VGG25_09200, partial [Streptosporangiaceae bacterium]